MRTTFSLLSKGGCCLLGLLLLLVAAPGAKAAPGDYTTVICANPDTGLGVGQWPSELVVNYNQVTLGLVAQASNCSGAMTGSKGIVLTNTDISYAEGAWGMLTWTPPAGLALVSASIYRQLTLPSTGAYFTVAQHASASTWIYYPIRGERYEWLRTESWVSQGTGATPFASANRVEMVAENGVWSIQVICDSAGRGPCQLPPGGVMYRIFGGKVVLRDAANPTVSSSPSGSLVAAETLSGNAEATFHATDAGSGLYRLKLFVDDVLFDTQLVDSNGGACTDVNSTNANPYEFAHTRPCKLAAGGTYTFTTRGIADGAHNVKLAVEDAGGNSTTFVNRSVTIDNVGGDVIRPKTLRRPRIKLKISPKRTFNKRKIHWRGRIVGGSLPRGGVTVLAQVRQGNGWTVFKQIPVGKRGRFKFKYRFHATTVATSYTFRVALTRIAGHKVKQVNSNSVKVRVEP